ncbi:hypothetical protein skT53_06630 [Effusibacillus dendaii]|uniref:Uncharacterized protein n=2 Tax=Effusibacillus dendaii TaxID=2743772 RepID=A0A7I8D694_9BACL|nr:hypothetical protein skT53_06630 [Effusibacillus dendaii]
MGPFEKYVRNPILGPQGDAWEAKDLFNPTAIVENGKVYLGQTARLCLATSKDLLLWEKHGALFPGWNQEPNYEWSKSGAIVPQRINGQAEARI